MNDPIVERTTVHVSDDTGRIAMLETRTIGSATDDNDTLAELTRYIYSNHLQSASLELDDNGEIISYEEYHPYGTSAYQARNSDIKATAKRYRYTGKERDDESGLYYHGARYYMPWLCRWSAVDPLESKYAGMSAYNYSFNNPVMFNDPSGMGPDDPPQSVSTVDNTRVAARAMAPIYVDPNAPLPDISGFLSGRGSETEPIQLKDVPIYSGAPTVDNLTVNGGYHNDQDIPTGPLAEYAAANSKYYKENSELLSGEKISASSYSQGREEYKYEKAERIAREHQVRMLMASQDNPVTGMFNFAANDVIGTAENAYSSIQSYGEGKYLKGTLYAGLTLLAVDGYGNGGLSRRIISEVGWSSKSLKLDAMKLYNASTTNTHIEGVTREEAEEILLFLTTGNDMPSSYRNTPRLLNEQTKVVDEFNNVLKLDQSSDWLPGGRGAFDEPGTYHWDAENLGAGVGDHAKQGEHLQIHTFEGLHFRIFIKK